MRSVKMFFKVEFLNIYKYKNKSVNIYSVFVVWKNKTTNNLDVGKYYGYLCSR